MGLFEGGGFWINIEEVERKVRPPRRLPLWAALVLVAVVGSLLMIAGCSLLGRAVR